MCNGSSLAGCMLDAGFDYTTIMLDRGFMNYDGIHCDCFREYCAKHKPDMKQHYKYFLTFTKKPDVDKDEVLRNFEKFCSRSSTLEITRLWYTKEHWTDDSNPHIHAYVESTRSMPKSRYKHYEKSGKIDKQKAKGSLAQIEDYMSKESEIVKLI